MSAVKVGFVAWPVPTVCGAMAGALLGAHGPGGRGGQAVILAVAVVVLGAALVSTVVARGGSPAPQRRRRAVVPLLTLLVFVAAGLRYEAWEHAPNPAAALFGVTQRWVGSYDGLLFRADEPVTAAFAVVSRVALPPGRLELTATAQAAPGKRNPGGFDYAGYLRRRGVAGQLFVEEVLVAVERLGPRQRLERGVRAGLKPEDGALVSAVTLGLKDDLGDELKTTFNRAGLAHLLALSGLHFGVLLAAASWALTSLGRYRAYALMVLTVGFVLLVGTAPSVVRAASMALAYLVGRAGGSGRLEPLPVLALAGTGALIVQPQMLFDLSFQLSYLALLGLLTFTGPLSGTLGLLFADGASPAATPAPRRRPGLKTFVISGLAASLAAQLPSLSLVAGAFGSVPLFSPLVNLVAVPLSTLLVPLGFGAGLVGLVAEPLAALLNRVTHLVVWLLTAVAQASDGLPQLPWPEVGWLGHLCWTSFVLALALCAHRRLRLRQLLAVALVAGACSALAGGAQRPPDVWFLDVGQGDATLIRLPGRFEVLIDGGGSPFSEDDVGERVVLPALRALDVDELELVVATHPDADHVEGLFTVLERLPVGTLVTAPAAPGNALDDELREIADSRGVDVHVATRAETITIGRRGSASLEVLHPVAGGGGGSPNEESVVLLLRYRGVPAVLLLADVGSVTERGLALGRVAVLKVGHHGSRYSTSPELLRATAPGLAVISVGRNNYGHPHESVLARLGAAGVSTRTTQAEGAVRVDLSRALPARQGSSRAPRRRRRAPSDRLFTDAHDRARPL